MAFSLSILFLTTIFSLLILSLQQQPLNSVEQESVYLALESVNPQTQWRTLFPDDLCLSSPHGVVCSYFPIPTTQNDTVLAPHIIELNFGFVFDSSDTPSCSFNSSFPLSLSSLPHLRKLFFYRCFTHSPVLLPAIETFPFDLEEIVFMENPALFGSLSGNLGNFTSLKRFILTGSNFSGGIPDEITKLPLLEQLTISGNSNLIKGIPENLGNLENLKILDLSKNGLDGFVPESLGKLKLLLKLDLSYNNFVGGIPESFKNLQNLEFLDLGFNRFGNFGVPLFLGKMHTLRELHLSGNPLEGRIPEIWQKLGGILGIGLSGVSLVGNIPASMGVFLRNVSYIGLDNNKLEGTIPKEFGLLENLNEMNLQNNQLCGRIPFSTKFVARIGGKLKLEGNFGICIDESIRWDIEKVRIKLRNLSICNSTTEISNAALFFNGGFDYDSGSSVSHSWYLVILVGVFWSFYLVGC